MTEENIQLNLVFEKPAHETIKEAIIAAVSNSGMSQRAVAAELDYSPQEFHRILSSEEYRYFPVEKLPKLLEITGDYTPLYWLVNKFLMPLQDAREQQFQEFLKAMPKIEKLLKTIKKGKGVG